MAKGEDLCLVKLSKSYEDIERLLNLWNETDRHSNELIQSLTSPLEQLHSCEKACFKRSPLVDFDGLKEKLQHKLLKQTEIIMAKLQDDMNTFKIISKKMSTHWSSSLQVYTLYSGSLPMTMVCEGTPTQPSIADLLEWLNDLERIHRELCEEKIEILGRITYITPMANVYTAMKEWASTQNRHAHKIRDIMERVAVFLANRT